MKTFKVFLRFGLVVSTVFSLVASVGVPTAFAALGSYRWRNDDGSESAATFSAAEDTVLDGLVKNASARLRFGVGNPGTESEFARDDALILQNGDGFSSGVIDTNGYAYFCTITNPVKIVKFRLNAGDTTPTKVATFIPDLGEITRSTYCKAMIDVANGYLYFAVGAYPAVFIKVAPGSGDASPTLVGTLTLDSGENGGTGAVIDATNGYAYLGTSTSPAKIVKVSLGSGAAAPTRVGALTLESGENNVTLLANIDVANGYGYFGTNTSPSIIVKVALGSGAALPTRIGAVTLSAGENYCRAADIDTANGYLYVATYTNPGYIVKVELGSGSNPPARVGALTSESGEAYFKSGFIDAANGYGYFAGQLSPGYLVKVALGSGAALPTRVGALALAGVNNSLTSASVFDASTGYGYFAEDYSTSPSFYKVTLGIGAALPTLASSLEMMGGDDYGYGLSIDSVGGYAYMVTGNSPAAALVKIRLGQDGSADTRLGSLTLNDGEMSIYVKPLLDVANGYAYLIAYGPPTIVIKVSLGTGDALPTRIGSTLMEVADGGTQTAAIDTVHGYLYLKTDSSPINIVKVALGSGAALPTRIGATAMDSGENNWGSLALDTTRGYGYIGTQTSPAKVIKFSLGDGTALPTRIGALTLESGESGLWTAPALDMVNGYVYFASQTSPATIIKVAVGDGAALPTRIGALTLESGESSAQAPIVADWENGYGYLTSYSNPGKVIKFAFGAGAALPTRIGSITLNTSEGYIVGANIDTQNGYVYDLTSDVPSRLIRTSIAPKPQFRLEYGRKETTCAAISSWTQVPATATTEHWQMYNSSYLTDAAATTDNAGVSDVNSYFSAGQVKDTASQTGYVSLGESQFSEVEYSVIPSDNAIDGGAYCFRLTDAGITTAFSEDNYAEVIVAPIPHSTGSGASGNPVQPDPAISILTPVAGASYDPGSVVNIAWTSANGAFTSYKSYYSDNGGASWNLVAEDGTVTNAVWTVPDVATTEAKVRVEGYDGSGNILAVKTLAGVFAITGTGAPAVPPSVSYDRIVELQNTPSIETDKGLVAPSPDTVVYCDADTLIKADGPAVYYCGADGKRYVFPNINTFRTWYQDFSSVITISAETLAKIPLGGNVTYRPGYKLVKITTDPKVYAVSRGGILRWVTTEALARDLYGDDWNKQVSDIPDAFFVNYTMGEPIE